MINNNNLFKLIEKKLFTVNKSYHESFNNLNSEELNDLCKYDFLLEKVHKELKHKVSSEDLDFFNRHLEVYRDKGSGFNELFSSALKKDIPTSNNIFFTKADTTRFDLRQIKPFYSKLMDKACFEESWVKTNKCLFDKPELINKEAVSNLLNGFSLKDLDSYDNLLEAINCVAIFLKDIVTTTDFKHIFNVCYHNEKFMFMLLYPFLLKPLGKIAWVTLLPVFHFVSGSFTTFMKKVDTYLKTKNLNKTFITYSVKKSAKIAIGVSSVGLLALFSNHYTKQATQSVITANEKVYKGIEGVAGSYFKLLRFHGAKICFEVAKTVSVFVNAAITGAIEPKKEMMKDVLNSQEVRDLIKYTKK